MECEHGYDACPTCDSGHAWGAEVRSPWANSVPGPSANHPKNGAASHWTPKVSGQFCPCGAWLGSLGLEPTPELFVEHLVEVFRAVWPVLRDDGVIWVNLGSSYAGSGKGPTGHNGIGDQTRRQGFDKSDSNRGSLKYSPLGGKPTTGYKPKDLIDIPHMVAEALRQDGWYRRSDIPWLKRNAMPESVTDRPATAVEYVFLLSKSARYYWDAAAVRSVAKNEGYVRKAAKSKHRDGANEGNDHRTIIGFVERDVTVNGRNRRNSDWFFDSWQGLLLDEVDEPLAFVVNPAGFKGSHFATFPPKLVEPMIKASTRPGDTVLDCFAGAGTVALVADRLGRNAIGIDLKPSYVEMQHDRVTNDAPMFADVEVA